MEKGLFRKIESSIEFPAVRVKTLDIDNIAVVAQYSRLYLPAAEKFTQIDMDVFTPAISSIYSCRDARYCVSMPSAYLWRIEAACF
jgi:hypothetical protein